MRDGEAKVGMRVTWNVKARRTKGIVGERDGCKGAVSQVGLTNGMGGEVVRVEWDNGEWTHVSPNWIKREWAVGGYRPLKRRDETV